jgi:hypothetical protein
MKRFSSVFKKLDGQNFKTDFLLLVLTLSCLTAKAAPALTFSGISSGGFMAAQMGTIYSSQVSGVGTVAGGFFYCAQNHLQEKIAEGLLNPFVGRKNLFLFQQSPSFISDVITGQAIFKKGDQWLSPAPGNPIYQSVGICMMAPVVADLPDLKAFEKKGLIDAVSNIATQKIYIYQGDSDTVVNPKMASRMVEYYQANGVAKTNIRTKTLDGGHNFPTDKIGLNDCKNHSVPYVSSCKFNLAEDMLQHLLGRELTRITADLKNFYRVDQNLEPVNEGQDRAQWQSPAKSLGAYGYLYASPACLAHPETCELHVALHGCEMSDSFDKDLDKQYSDQVAQTQILALRSNKDLQLFSLSIGATHPVEEDRQLRYGALKFALSSGYIELAEKNNLMILFPQTWITPDNYPYNPKGCWDWFGANGSNYATNQGVETSWLIQYAQNIKAGPQKYIMSTKPDFDQAVTKSP